MAKALKFRVGDEEVLIAPVGAAGGVTASGLTETAVAAVEKSLDEALKVLGKIATGFRSAVAGAGVKSAEVEFGIKFTGSGSLYVVEGEAEAAFKVTLHIEP